MPLQATSGAASYDAFGGGVAAVPNYIEDVFSTYLYTGTGAMRSISNGIDLAGEGGLVWIKDRAIGYDHCLFDTARGVDLRLVTNSTGAQATQASRMVTAFNSDGFTLGNVSTGTYDAVNELNQPFASWTFRKQPKFFDVVTYTGDGTSSRNIPHELGSKPHCIIIKNTSTAQDWFVSHIGVNSGLARVGKLNTTAAFATSSEVQVFYSNDSTFRVGTGGNNSGDNYVAYLFAHNAGGFGLTGTDNVISCGSYTGNNTSLQSIDLGYEPQLVLIKSTYWAGTDWVMLDNMRGVATGGVDAVLNPNTSGAEASPYDRVDFTSTGFNLKTSSADYNETGTYIYIAIRRGPMKVPTSGTSVFAPVTYTGTGASLTTTTGINQDVLLIKSRTQTYSALFTDRLRGVGGYWINTASTAGENGANTTAVTALSNTSFTQGGGSICGASGSTYVGYGFTRAPSFFDEVCYTGTGVVGRAVLHNLGVAPELLIVKERSGVGNWEVIAKDALGGLVFYQMNSTQAGLASRDGHLCFPTATFVPPTATQFVVGADDDVNGSGSTYVAYLFATCAGVSKVGSYTGTGTTLQVDCGFTGGARFVLIKRTDSTGAWYVWDSARGIVAGNDPYLLLNSTAAEVTNTDFIDTASTGFEISSTAPAAINASGGTYIFLAIA